MTARGLSDPKEIDELLTRLRDDPVDSTEEADRVLMPLFNYLMSVPAHKSDGLFHWFCEKAEKTTLEAATFLLRLFAYESGGVVKWKQRLQQIFLGCCHCVGGIQLAKVNSEKTYLGAFPDDVLRDFMLKFDEWELGLLLPRISNSESATIDAPASVVYHVVSNLNVVRHPSILFILETKSLPSSLLDWPPDPPPPGLFYLHLHRNPEVRLWAESLVCKSRIRPISKELFVRSYITVLETLCEIISANRNSHTASSTSIIRNDEMQYLSSDPAVTWKALSELMRYSPPELFQCGSMTKLDIRHLIAGHLHDTGPHFLNVLRCFLYLLTRLTSDLWKGEASDYPNVIFDAIKDNSSYAESVRLLRQTEDPPWYLHWFTDYIKSIWTSPVLSTTFAKMADFLCGELQHERFGEARSMIMTAASMLFRTVVGMCNEDSAVEQRIAVFNTLDIHLDRLTAIAFARPYSDPKWSAARSNLRDLIFTVLQADVKRVATTIDDLVRYYRDPKRPVPSLVVRPQLWKQTYNNIQAIDTDSIAMLITTVAKSAHMFALRKTPFTTSSAKDQSANPLASAEAALDTVNQALGVVHAGFSDTLSKYANYNSAVTVQELLRRPNVARDLTILMLCPIEQLHSGAQTLIGQAYDVDVRVDCFRALLKNLPDATFTGLLTSLSTFAKYTERVPESCDLSKALVRCMTDVIEVLCSSLDGLLLDEAYLKGADGASPSASVPQLWHLMSKSLTIIFQKTPTWSQWFDPEDMIVWMRDALIFGRDMLAQWRVFESAAVYHSDPNFSQSIATSRKISRPGKKMIADLQPVLFELLRWLRLTDEELLHQSYALLETLFDVFKKMDVLPTKEILAKLSRMVSDARERQRNPNIARPQTRLDSARISKLETILAGFDDDEIEFVAETPAPSTSGKASSTSKSTSSVSSRQSTLVPSSRDTTVVPSASKSSSRKLTSGDSRSSTPSTSSSVQQKSVKPTYPTTSRFFGKKTEDAEVPSAAFPKFTMPAPGREDRSAEGKKTISSTRKENEKPARDEASEDSSADSGEEGGFAALNEMRRRSPKIRRPVERRQVKLMDMPTNAKNPMQERLNQREEARRTALRLKPDISQLHRTILSWSWDHSGSDPPTSKKWPTIGPVPDKFTDYAHYRRVFEPLLVLECWAQLLQSKEEQQEAFQCKISSRQFTDDWLDLDISLDEGVDNNWYLVDTDIVRLHHPTETKSMLAKVQNFKVNSFGAKSIVATVRCYLGGGASDPGLNPGSTWRVAKAFSLSTLHREYAALVAMEYYDLTNFILKPQLNKKPSLDRTEIQSTETKYNVNEPQAIAIASVMRTNGVSLIQGPPGTGKTSTICGLVQAFLSKRITTTNIHVGRTSGPADKVPPKKVLLCAPSNAAIDEVVHRIKEGVSGAGRKAIIPNVVRVGAPKAININVQDVSLDNLVDQMLEANESSKQKSSKESGSELALLRSELESVKQAKREKQDELVTIHDNVERSLAIEDEIKKLNSRRVNLSQQIDRLKDQQKSDRRTLDATRRKFRLQVLLDADVICSTLSGTGHELLEQLDFDMIIIDEAAQAIELSSLIPLKYRSSRVVMVGDPQQLPPTVISMEATKYLYNQSLFVRLQKHRPDAVHLLSIQYRMHPDISQLPSALFYGGQLQDGPNMVQKTQRLWHTSPKFGTYRFFNVLGGQESQGSSHSYMNAKEVRIAVTMFNRLRQEFSSVDFDFRVGVVSMYREQIVALRRAFEQRFGRDIVGKVDFNTVDGFQGQEKDIIILSCVRAGPGVQSVGFLADVRRMNVALTRSRASLFILGHAPTLERSDQNWKAIVSDARSRSLLFDVDEQYFTTSGLQTRPIATKPTKPTLNPRPTAAVPSDLSTPKAFKASVKETSSPTPASTSAPSVPAKPFSVARKPSSDASASMPSPQPKDTQSAGGTKRARSKDDEVTVPSSIQPNAPPKAKAPPAKRQKQGASLFIPKKRPAQDDMGGPSKRR